MATYDSGKSIDRSTKWSDWEFDPRGFSFRSRRGPTGEQEYDYDYDSNARSRQHAEATQAEFSSIQCSPRIPQLTQVPEDYCSSWEIHPDSPDFTTVRSSGANIQWDRGLPPQVWSTRLLSPPPVDQLSSSPAANNLSVRLGSFSISPSENKGRSTPYFSTLLAESGEVPREYDNSNDAILDFETLSLKTSSPPQDTSDQIKVEDTRIFDPRYKVIEKKKLTKFWTIGRVFKTLWFDPDEANHQPRNDRYSKASSPSVGSQATTAAGYVDGEAYFESCWFVVVDVDFSGAFCCPICTYDGQACMKSNLPEISSHAIIYTSENPPNEHYTVQGGRVEYELLSIPPIKVVDERRDGSCDLDVKSRLNFSKVYKFDLYTEVSNVGIVHPDWMRILTYNTQKWLREESPQHPKYRSSRTSKNDYLGAKAGSHSGEKVSRGSERKRSKLGKHGTDILYLRESYHHLVPPRVIRNIPHGQETVSTPLKLKKTLDNCKDQETQLGESPLGVNTLSSYSSSVAEASPSLTHELYSKSLLVFFTENPSLKPLFQEALRNLKSKSFEYNLHKALRQFAENLGVEASSLSLSSSAMPQLHSISKLMHQCARNTSHQIRRKLENERSRERARTRFSEHPIDQETNSFNPEIPDEDEDKDHEEDSRNGEGGEKMEKISPELETLIIRTNAFQVFQDNLRLLMSSDPYERALSDIWPVMHSKSAAAEIHYDVYWELPKILHSDRVKPEDFGRLLTLTGEFDSVQASSCEDYITVTWPGIGSFLLGAITSFLETLEDVDMNTGHVSLKIQHAATESKESLQHLELHFKAPHNLQLELLCALSWLSSAFRTSSRAAVQYSSVAIDIFDREGGTQTPKERPSLGNMNQIIRVMPENLEDCPSISCWHPLFPKGVIAKGFPIAARTEGKGLEISFADMALITGCLGFVSHENGLIAHGLKSVLIPILEIEDGDAIQWHFEDKTKQGNGRIARISQTLRREKILHWHQELSPERLINRRCFLGWAETANIVLGTRKYQSEFGTFKQSGASQSPRNFVNKTYAFTFSGSFMGWVTVQGSHERTRTAMKASLVLSPNQHLYDTLAASYNDLVIFYDNASKLAWCLPQACIVLHMAHTFVSTRGYELFNGAQPFDVERNSSIFASPSPDGAAAACLALKSCSELTVRKGVNQSGPIEESFSEIISRIWHNLTNIGEALDGAEADFQIAGHVAPKYLHGVEMIDAANSKTPIRFKMVQVNQPWAHLTSEQPIVLFSKNIPPAIIPSCENLCESWATVPPRQNYLVAMGIAARVFLERRDDGLAKGLEWRSNRQLVQCHKHQQRTPIYHSQTLELNRKPRSNGPTLHSIKQYPNSCLIFGKGKEKACLEALNGSAAPLQSSNNNSPEQPKTLRARLSTLASNMLPEAGANSSSHSGSSEEELSSLQSSDIPKTSPTTNIVEPPVSRIHLQSFTDTPAHPQVPPKSRVLNGSSQSNSSSQSQIELNESANYCPSGELSSSPDPWSNLGDNERTGSRSWKGKGKVLMSTVEVNENNAKLPRLR